MPNKAVQWTRPRAGRATDLGRWTPMEWKEINLVIEALESLIASYEKRLKSSLSENDNADLSNDLALAKILLGRYQHDRDSLRK